MKDFQHTIAIIGCGNLGQSIANGLLDTGLPASQLILTRRSTVFLEQFAQRGVTVTNHNKQAVEDADIILFGLKPYNILQVLESVKSAFRESHQLASLASGVTIRDMEQVIGTQYTVYRAMPNTAADVSESLTCLSSNGNGKENSSEIESIFNAIGETVFIDEQLMDAATVLGACGIAFVLRFIRAMIQGGIQIGFDAKTANTIVNQTVKGASQLLIERENHPEFEIDKVTTPKGCTIEGLNEMEHHGFSSALIKGIISSYKLLEK